MDPSPGVTFTFQPSPRPLHVSADNVTPPPVSAQDLARIEDQASPPGCPVDIDPLPGFTEDVALTLPGVASHSTFMEDINPVPEFAEDILRLISMNNLLDL